MTDKKHKKTASKKKQTKKVRLDDLPVLSTDALNGTLEEVKEDESLSVEERLKKEIDRAKES